MVISIAMCGIRAYSAKRIEKDQMMGFRNKLAIKARIGCRW